MILGSVYLISLMSENLHALRTSYQHNTLLKVFRDRQAQCRSIDDRFSLVKEYAALVLPDDPFHGPHCPKRTRRHYYKRRADGWAKGMTRPPCWICGNTAKHRHHVIPLSGGGRNRKDNLLPLCVLCHRGVHGGRQRGQEQK